MFWYNFLFIWFLKKVYKKVVLCVCVCGYRLVVVVVVVSFGLV